jgi:hypothetical protein
MTPDAIIILSTGLKKDASGIWRPTDYADRDAFGTLGGIERVRAAALLAAEYPESVIVTTCKQMSDEPPTHASVYADALVACGIPRERILLEERSTNSQTQVREAIALAQEKGWRSLFLVASEFQLPRVRAFWEACEGEKPRVEFVSAESVLIPKDPSFAEAFEKAKRTPAYESRLAAEARGVAAVKSGNYRSAPIGDKKERSA